LVHFGVAAVETGGKQVSAGHLHLVIQIWLHHKKISRPEWDD